MSFRATHRNARIAPRKARLVADMIRGMNAAEALVALEFSPQRAAWYYKSVLKSAMANAEELRMAVLTSPRSMKSLACCASIGLDMTAAELQQVGCDMPFATETSSH